MKERFIALCKRLKVYKNPNELYSDLVSSYSEVHRRYHTLAHIEYCLQKFDSVRSMAFYPDSVELALWYHDVIYDLARDDNEVLSAVKLEADILVPQTSTNSVLFAKTLILATNHKQHISDNNDVHPDVKLCSDIDLSILGGTEQEFKIYERNIRDEFRKVPDDVFSAGRIALLRKLMNRPGIFSTPYFKTVYGQQATRNILASIKKLVEDKLVNLSNETAASDVGYDKDCSNWWEENYGYDGSHS